MGNRHAVSLPVDAGDFRDMREMRGHEIAAVAAHFADVKRRMRVQRGARCGRLGPATLGSTVARSSERVEEYSASGEAAVWKRPCSRK